MALFYIYFYPLIIIENNLSRLESEIVKLLHTTAPSRHRQSFHNMGGYKKRCRITLQMPREQECDYFRHLRTGSGIVPGNITPYIDEQKKIGRAGETVILPILVCDKIIASDITATLLN